jgi:hypothetical protein
MHTARDCEQKATDCCSQLAMQRLLLLDIHFPRFGPFAACVIGGNSASSDLFVP